MQFVNEGNNPEQFNPEQAVDIEAFIKEFNENLLMILVHKDKI